MNQVLPVVFGKWIKYIQKYIANFILECDVLLLKSDKSINYLNYIVKEGSKGKRKRFMDCTTEMAERFPRSIQSKKKPKLRSYT